MSIRQNTPPGERGGTTANLQQAQQLIEQHKAQLTDAVRADILQHLESHPEWHRDDLRVHLPAASKNVIGAVVIGLINRGVIRETGERRRSTAPASHGRKSNVYTLTLGGGDGRNPNTSCASGRAAVISPTGESGGESLGEIPAPKFPVEMTGGRKGAEPGVEAGSAPTLFNLGPDPKPAPGHMDLDQREAA